MAGKLQLTNLFEGESILRTPAGLTGESCVGTEKSGLPLVMDHLLDKYYY